uniref:N-alpha-acetyltransferase 60 n=1 Tax=Panagrellus redivivus TaxID=6233 RepID=A0A7E5A1L1_PANRE
MLSEVVVVPSTQHPMAPSTDETTVLTLPSTSESADSSQGLSGIILDGQWRLDTLRPKDLNAVAAICKESFPLDYPQSWYEDVVTGRFIAYGVFYGQTLTSLLVAEIKKIADCDNEDKGLDSDPESLVVYILSLAVSSAYRRRGIATVLLDYLLKTYVNNAFPKLVFLHVLSTNYGAISFYKRSGFKHYSTIPNYYYIDNTYQSGSTFVLYTARSVSPYSVSAMFNYVLAYVCRPFRALFRSKFC